MFCRTHCDRDFRLRKLLLVIAFLLSGPFTPGASAFEQDQRINSLTLEIGTNSFATANRFGSAFTSTAQGQVNSGLNNNISNGTVTVLFEMPELTNLTGSNQPSFSIGVVNGHPVCTNNNPATYSGLSDLDWWYTPTPNELDPYGIPTNQLPSSIVSGVLNSGPGRLNFVPSPFGPGEFDLSAVAIAATIGSSSAPLESTNGFPPGHLPAENINPLLVSFASMSAGKLKGNISAAFLASTPIPNGIAGNDGYTASNSFLDVMVSGYSAFGGFITLILPTQPDQIDPTAPVAGAGPPYSFFAGAGKVVTTAHDKNGGAVPLVTALNAMSYSSYFTFTTDRVIVQSPPAPVLTVANSGNQIIVSWPCSLTGWTLQTNNNLATGTWGNYAGQVANNSVTNSPSAGTLFFRLIHP
jgi:hypothetical protein